MDKENFQLALGDIFKELNNYLPCSCCSNDDFYIEMYNELFNKYKNLLNKEDLDYLEK